MTRRMFRDLSSLPKEGQDLVLFRKWARDEVFPYMIDSKWGDKNKEGLNELNVHLFTPDSSYNNLKGILDKYIKYFGDDALRLFDYKVIARFYVWRKEFNKEIVWNDLKTDNLKNSLDYYGHYVFDYSKADLLNKYPIK